MFSRLPFPRVHNCQCDPDTGPCPPPDLVPALPHRGPPCCPVATQVKGDRHDLCQHQLCVLQLQRPQFVSAPASPSSLFLGSSFIQK